MKICLISAIHLWVNPRLVREADLLAEKGHEVCVITASKDAWSEAQDKIFLEGKRWRVRKVRMVKKSSPVGWFFSALREKFFFELSKMFPANLRFAEEAIYRGYAKALRWAVQENAQVYIAHQQASLGIAARAAAFHKAPFGFDCEDLNAVALADGMRHPQIKKNIQAVEREYLKKAKYVSVTSKPMADFLVSEYGIPAPALLYNVFSKKDLSGIQAPATRAANEKFRMVWVSATIGPGRGLETAIQSLTRLPQNCELHIYGRPVNELYKAKLTALVDSNIRSRVFFHGVIGFKEFFKTFADYDAGLALEDSSCQSLSRTLTNKFFIYLQTGLAIIATDVPGQRSLFQQHANIGTLVKPNDGEAFFRAVLEYAKDRSKLLEAKTQSWKLGQEIYNWEENSRVFLSAAGLSS